MFPPALKSIPALISVATVFNRAPLPIAQAMCLKTANHAPPFQQQLPRSGPQLKQLLLLKHFSHGSVKILFVFLYEFFIFPFITGNNFSTVL